MQSTHPMNDTDLFHELDSRRLKLIECVCRYAIQVDPISLYQPRVPQNGAYFLDHIHLPNNHHVLILGKQVDSVLVMQLVDQGMNIKQSHA